MIRKLKIKFILLSASALLILLTVIVAGMNIVNYTSVTEEVDEILALLSQNRGTFPDGFNDAFDPAHPESPALPGMGQGNRLPPHMSPEIPYESRYFSVLLTAGGTVLQTDVSRIASVDEAQAIEYALSILDTSKELGFVNEFRYLRASEGDTTRIVFLDCGRRLDSFHAFLYTSISIALVGFVAVFLLLCFFAGRIIRPIAESYEKQKRFITDAGHEIKTPLTIIHANADILEMELGKNECISDIQQQAKRLTALTNDLVYLSRMEETENQSFPMIELPISEIVQETADTFRPLAITGGKHLSCEIQPMLSLKGNPDAVRELVSVLLDNALKYAPSEGAISLNLTKQNRSVILTVFNKTDFLIDPEHLDRVFDRFYRTDPSRNSTTGGHGIGLSMAHAIVTAHKGKITASTDDGYSFRITVTLPI